MADKYKIMSDATMGVFDNHELDITGLSNGIDQYMEQTVLEAIEYIGRNIKWMVEKDGEILFWNGREYLTKEQLFENFL